MLTLWSSFLLDLLQTRPAQLVTDIIGGALAYVLSENRPEQVALAFGLLVAAGVVSGLRKFLPHLAPEVDEEFPMLRFVP